MLKPVYRAQQWLINREYWLAIAHSPVTACGDTSLSLGLVLRLQALCPPPHLKRSECDPSFDHLERKKGVRRPEVEETPKVK
jgi:hypothetical protein